MIGEVANGYFNLRALDRQIDIAERTVSSRRESVVLQRARFEGGEINGDVTLPLLSLVWNPNLAVT